MSAQAITIISGIALLVVFALVGWGVRIRSGRRSRKRTEDPKTRPGSPRGG
jgi:hypothetical protein